MADYEEDSDYKMEAEEIVVLLPDDETLGEDLTYTPEKYVWNRQMTLMLVEEYKKYLDKFLDKSVKKINLWNQIADTFKEQGMEVTADMCHRKFRNMKKTWRDIHTSNRTEVSKRRWEFYAELKQIFLKDPKMIDELRPQRDSYELENDPLTVPKQQVLVSVVNTPRNTKVNAQKTNGQVDAQLPRIIQIHPATSESGSVSSPEQPVWFRDFLELYDKNERTKLELLENMHKDVMEVEQKKCTLLETLINKLN